MFSSSLIRLSGSECRHLTPCSPSLQDYLPFEYSFILPLHHRACGRTRIWFRDPLHQSKFSDYNQRMRSHCLSKSGGFHVDDVGLIGSKLQSDHDRARWCPQRSLPGPKPSSWRSTALVGDRRRGGEHSGTETSAW